jgi:hypothetical protein
LPSLHGGKLTWATASNNVRWTYRILKKDKGRGWSSCGPPDLPQNRQPLRG